MADKKTQAGQPIDQMSELMKGVTAALHDASAHSVASNRQITERVMQQAEENARQLFDTLQLMASKKDPSELARIYTEFITTSAQKQTSQLLEIGQAMAKASKDTWGPITDAIRSIASAEKS